MAIGTKLRKKKEGIALTEAEEFFEEIYTLSEFKTLQELNNRGKHHITSGKAKTSKTQGAKAGLARSGDTLRQEYFLIDGRDSRMFFEPIIKKYHHWFFD